MPRPDGSPTLWEQELSRIATAMQQKPNQTTCDHDWRDRENDYERCRLCKLERKREFGAECEAHAWAFTGAETEWVECRSCGTKRRM